MSSREIGTFKFSDLDGKRGRIKYWESEGWFFLAFVTDEEIIYVLETGKVDGD